MASTTQADYRPAEDEFDTAYERCLGRLDRAGESLKQILNRLIEDQSIASAPGAFLADDPAIRIKPKASVLRKSKIRNIPPAHGLEIFDDLVGARVICQGLADVENVVQALSKHPRLSIVYVDPYNRLILGDESGYRGRHVVADLEVEDGTDLVKVRAEIQIRTTVQHAWAKVSRHDFYAREPGDVASLPKWLAGRLKLLSDRGLELDRELQDVRDAVSKQYAATSRALRHQVNELIDEGQHAEALGCIREALSSADPAVQLASIDALFGAPPLWPLAEPLVPALASTDRQVKDRFVDKLNEIEPRQIRQLNPLIRAVIGI